MKKLLTMAALAALVMLPILAQAFPVTGMYTSTDLGGQLLTGRASTWRSGVNSGLPHVLHAQSWDGANLGTFAAGGYPLGIVFDGSHVWVSNHMAGTLTKLRPSDGAIVGVFPAPANPYGLAFDGRNIWFTDTTNGTATKVRRRGHRWWRRARVCTSSSTAASCPATTRCWCPRPRTVA